MQLFDGALWTPLAHGSTKVLPFLGIGMRIDLFQSCGHCQVFQICLYNKCNALMASSFRVLNSSTGIPLHPQAFLTQCFLRPTLLSRMSGSGWLMTPSQQSSLVHLDLFYAVFSMYSFHFFFISSMSTRSLPFISFILPIFGKSVPLASQIFLMRSLVFQSAK